MNIDIQTEHAVMQPEWHRMIEMWVERCRRQHPEVLGLELNLRHGDPRHRDDQVDVVATARGHSLRAVGRAEGMTQALYDALATLEQELLVHEAVSARRPGDAPHPS